jgi:SUR7/PalI family
VIDIIAASLMTAAFVDGRNVFNDAGIPASLGVKAFGFAWGSVGALLIATFGFCGAACGPGRRKNRDREYSADGTRTGRFWRRRNKVPADAPPATY